MYVDMKRRSLLWLIFLATAVVAATEDQVLSKKDHAAGTDDLVARNALLLEPQVQGNLSVDIPILPHPQLDGRGLVKRQMANPADDQKFYHYRCKGETMLEFMLTTENKLIQMFGAWAQVHTIRNDMYSAGAGWSAHPVYLFDIQNVDPSILNIAGLTGIQGISQSQPLRLQNHGNGETPWTKSRSVQDTPYTRADLGDQAQRPATGAVYESISSFAQEVIIVTSAYGPKHMSSLSTADGKTLPDKQLPKVQQLSEGLYAHWGDGLHFRLEAVATKTDPPKWVLVSQVEGPPDTLSVVTSCLRRYGWATQQLPTWQNRITFPVGTYCYSAILGTPNSRGIAMFLITHKFRFSPSIPASVTVYGSGFTNAQGQEVPSLLWHISREQPLRRFRKENEDYQAKNPDDNDITKVPHRLRPQPIDPNGDSCWVGGIPG